ncbi:MAG: 4Fe-4S dicluster domain-containing protein [Luteolibacter sp.]
MQHPMNPPNPSRASATLERADFSRLFEVLRGRGYQVVGPTVRDGAIVYDSLNGPEQLPVGWGDEQESGTYRLKKRDDDALFGYVVGPHSWKKYLFPPEQRIFKARRTADGFEVQPEEIAAPKLAFLGVRSCELHAIAVQDRVFLGGQFVDAAYQIRRANAFIIAVNCGQAAGTCFCVSMNTGPKATMGFDLALTEILEDGRHYFVIESGSNAGAEVLAELPRLPSTPDETCAAEVATARAVSQMGRELNTTGIKELLYRNLENPHWEDVADRCLSCANCTMVCPTCFCSNVEDVTDLTGENAERWRKWDSCFTLSFSHVVGGAVRPTVKSRYRQWLTHKLATWIDQFGSSGCVGCGRCITWCPVAIDLTEEVRAIRESEISNPSSA